MKGLDVVLWCLIAAIIFLIGTFFFLDNVVYADYTGTIVTDEGFEYTIVLRNIPTPVPTPTPEPTIPPPTDYEVELITVVGNIEAFLIFFAVVILCFFVYKFLRLFF